MEIVIKLNTYTCTTNYEVVKISTIDFYGYNSALYPLKYTSL